MQKLATYNPATNAVEMLPGDVPDEGGKGFWWIVKVFDPESNTTTTLDKFSPSIAELQSEIEDDGLWVFVSARIDKSQY